MDDALVASDLDLLPMFGVEAAKKIAEMIDESARIRPTAIVYDDGIARVGMYQKIWDNPNGNTAENAINEMCWKIAEELKNALLDEFCDKIVTKTEIMSDVGLVCGAYVDVPWEKWREYIAREERRYV